jgi:hypothetical protein
MTHLGLTHLDRVSWKLAPRHRSQFWILIGSLPASLGLIVILATLLPAFGFGYDHCLIHDPHHPHLCPHHLSVSPGLIVIGMAGWILLRQFSAIIAFFIATVQCHKTSRLLREASDLCDDVWVFDASAPHIFVLGMWRPVVHVSRALLELPRDVVKSALAHERAHAKHGDLLWRALCPVISAAHLPWVSTQIQHRLATAQELSADAEAGDEIQDRSCIAEALVALARISASPSLGLSFTDGDLKVRVQALLAPKAAMRTWPLRLLIIGYACACAMVALLDEAVHHGLETILGTLN